MSISAWPSIHAGNATIRLLLGFTHKARREKQTKQQRELWAATMIGVRDELSQRELPAHQHDDDDGQVRVRDWSKPTRKAMAAVKLALLWAKYRPGERYGNVDEHDEEAAPRPSAMPIDRGRSSGSRRLIALWDTTACTDA